MIVEDRNELGYPPGMANRLHDYQWEPNPNGQSQLILPSFYARLFHQCFEAERFISDSKRLNSKRANTFQLQLEPIDPVTQTRVELFLAAFERSIVVGRNRFVEGHFNDELSMALALDLNYADSEQRTPLGQLEFRAKWQHSLDAIRVLAKHLKEVSRWLPIRLERQTICLMPVPQHLEAEHHLPLALVKEMAAAESDSEPAFELLSPHLTCRKPKLKDLSLDEKLACWQELVRTDKIVLSNSVAKRTVIVVDDLYQSGITMWSMARFLKSRGAAQVFGLACVKSIRDTDNL